MKNIESFYPLSPLQQGMLFETLLAPESEVYFEQFVCTLHGRLDLSAFERAWQRVVARHSALRTTFLWEGVKEPIQIVHKRMAVAIETYDWRDLPAAERQRHLQDHLSSDRSRGFELSMAPLMRLAVVQVSSEDHYFFWSHHHILLDGWSLALVLREVFALYGAFSRGRDLELSPVRSYQDYIKWLRRQDLSQAESFWREWLKGFRSPTRIGLDNNQGDSIHGHAEQQARLSESETTALQALARRRQLTINTIVQGAWAMLLSRYSGEEDVVFGATVSGRPTDLAGAERMVGLFINTLPIRVQVRPDEPVLSWLSRIQLQQAKARQHEHSPLVSIQGWSEVPRGLPLFESLVIYENYPVSELEPEVAGDLEIRGLGVFEQTNYPLTVIAGISHRLVLRLVYDRKRFGAAAIAQIATHVESLLKALAADPRVPVSSLSLLNEHQLHQIVTEWNDTTFNSGPACMTDLIAREVERSRDSVAVAYGEQQLSYGELDRMGNQLSRQLSRLGVKEEQFVGVCVERGLEMIVALVGVLKSGGAYVPLDPAYPKERLSLMIDDAGLTVLLSQERLKDQLLEFGVPLLCLDSDWELIRRESGLPQVTGLQPANSAYVIFTSGSTARPKGVQIEHRQVVNFLRSMRETPGLRGEDVLLALTTLSFDIAALELFLPLVVGARLTLVATQDVADAERLMRHLLDSGTTVMQATPATWRMLVDAGWPGTSGLKLLCGGEALPSELGSRLVTRGDQLWNLYGPTETTIWSAANRVELDDPAISISGPIGNTQIYLLDGHLNPAAPGVLGEVHIGGDGVGRGYLERPDLTAERFIPDAFSKKEGCRLYKTGDLARRRTDGRIEFHGRLDHQVKVRGYRIELGEIETTIGRYPGVRQAVVLARDDDSGGKRLVSYIVGEEGAQLTTNDIRRFAQGTLPLYMVPAAFVLLDSMPLTPNGKIDRSALPAPEKAHLDTETAYVAPRTPPEGMLADIWSEILGVEKVGIYDNFFALGGHSLMVTQVVNRIWETFQVKLAIRSVFDSPTVAALTRTIAQALIEQVDVEDGIRLLAELEQEQHSGEMAGSAVR